MFKVHTSQGYRLTLFIKRMFLVFTFLVIAFVLVFNFSVAYAADCGRSNELCCKVEDPPGSGSNFCTESTPDWYKDSVCWCDTGLNCAIPVSYDPSGNPVVLGGPKCVSCRNVDEWCCYSCITDDVSGKTDCNYECQQGLVCDQTPGSPTVNKCVAPSTDCDEVGSGCCVDYIGETLYCKKTKYDDLICNEVTNECYRANSICNFPGDPCCPDLANMTGKAYCEGDLICDPTSADEEAPKGRCREQGLCGGNNQICCQEADHYCPTASEGYVCLNGYCVNPQPLVGYKGPIFTDIASLLAPIFKILFYVGIFVGILGIIYSGYLFISSEGDPGRVKEGKEQFTAAILGSLFVLLSVFILRVIINNILGVDSGL